MAFELSIECARLSLRRGGVLKRGADLTHDAVMAGENPGILSHLAIGTSDLARAVRFCDAVLPRLASV